MGEIFRITMLPAQDGDSFLIEIGDGTSPYRLLVDGGRARAAETIERVLRGLPERNPRPLIDVLVLSHVDADHIEGLLKLLPTSPAGWFGDVWFNGKQHMAAARGIVVPKRPRAAYEEEPAIDVLSVAQGLAFGDMIEDRGMKWNEAFDERPVMTVAGAPLPAIDIPGGGRLTVLGPPVEKLLAFEPAWKAAFAEAQDPVLTLRTAGVREKVTAENIHAIAKRVDSADRTKPNGSSIAFAIEFKGKSALFAADAHPNDLASALKRYAPDGARATFSLVKASHHGSARNNTSELMAALESPCWLISTDGSRHQHPDPEAIARIVLNGPPGKHLVFNYASAFNEDWRDVDLQAAFSFTARYMQANEVFAVDLLA